MDLKIAVLVILGVLLICKVVYLFRRRARRKQANLSSSQKHERTVTSNTSTGDSSGENKRNAHVE